MKTRLELAWRALAYVFVQGMRNTADDRLKATKWPNNWSLVLKPAVFFARAKNELSLSLAMNRQKRKRLRKKTSRVSLAIP